jgi:hypothetical protein
VKVLAGLSGILALLCLAMGVVTFLGVTLPVEVPDEINNWTFWFGASAILFLASIAANMGKRPGGEEY